MNPKNFKYTKEHEWAKLEGTMATIGITKFASEQLGDVVFVQLPEVGTKVEKGKTLGVIESVKTVSDVYSPVSGKVVRKNVELEGAPEIVNQDPYGNGWILVIEVSDPKELNDLMEADAYEEHCAHCGH